MPSQSCIDVGRTVSTVAATTALSSSFSMRRTALDLSRKAEAVGPTPHQLSVVSLVPLLGGFSAHLFVAEPAMSSAQHLILHLVGSQCMMLGQRGTIPSLSES